MAKIKVNELSKTLGVKSSDLVELLKSAGSAVKGYSSLMSDMDMNIVLEHYTKLYDDGTDIYEFMKSLCPAVPEVKEEPKKEEKKAEVKEEKDPKNSPTTRTRSAMSIRERTWWILINTRIRKRSRSLLPSLRTL